MQELSNDFVAGRRDVTIFEQPHFRYATSSFVAVPTILTGPSSPSIPVDESTLAYDRSIRSHVRWRLDQATASLEATAVVDELPVCSGIARVDVAVLNGVLHGFEIKSERDTLARLHNQSQYFSEVVDYMTLVVVDQFASAAMKIVPEWWGICVVRKRGATVFFDSLRDCQPNTNVSVLSFLEFLWRDEAYDLARDAGISQGLKSATKAKIYRRLADEIPWDALHSCVLEKVRTRVSPELGGRHKSRAASSLQ